MKTIENNKTVENKQDSTQMNLKRLFTNIKSLFKYDSEVNNNSIEKVPVNSESRVDFRDNSEDKNYNKYGRTRAGYISGLYFYTKPFTYNDGGTV